MTGKYTLADRREYRVCRFKGLCRRMRVLP